MKRTPDPWRSALDQWTVDGSEGLTQPLDGLPAVASAAPSPRQVALTRPRLIGAIAVATLLLGGAVAGGVFTYLNHQRASDWRNRSLVLQDLVEERTKALNRQTARLNVASTTLRKAQTDIKRSEQDVQALEKRQRELANEKAQVEDARAQLTFVASSLATCNSGLADFINAVNQGLDPSVTLDVPSIAQTCQQADAAFRDYNGQ